MPIERETKNGKVRTGRKNKKARLLRKKEQSL